VEHDTTEESSPAKSLDGSQAEAAEFFGFKQTIESVYERAIRADIETLRSILACYLRQLRWSVGQSLNRDSSVLSEWIWHVTRYGLPVGDDDGPPDPLRRMRIAPGAEQMVGGNGWGSS